MCNFIVKHLTTAKSLRYIWINIQINNMVAKYRYSLKLTWHQAAGDSVAVCVRCSFILHIETKSIWYNNKNRFLWCYLVLSTNVSKQMSQLDVISKPVWLSRMLQKSTSWSLIKYQDVIWLILDMPFNGDNVIRDGRFESVVIMMKHYSNLCHMCVRWKCWKHWRCFLVLHFFDSATCRQVFLSVLCQHPLRI